MTTQHPIYQGKYSVYWVRAKDHTDVLSQGYVGITSETVASRISKHKNNSKRFSNTKKQTVFGRAILKHGMENLVVEVLCICEKEYALFIENKLRPIMLLGWNIAAGGSEGGRYRGHSHTEEARDKIRAAALGRKHTQAAKDKVSEARKRIKQIPFSQERKEGVSKRLKETYLKNGPWAHKSAKSLSWKYLDKIYEATLTGETSPAKIRKLVGLPPRTEIHPALKYIALQGDPSLDIRWVEWLAANKES